MMEESDDSHSFLVPPSPSSQSTIDPDDGGRVGTIVMDLEDEIRQGRIRRHIGKPKDPVWSNFEEVTISSSDGKYPKVPSEMMDYILSLYKCMPSTASVERVFSTFGFIQTDHRNRLSQEKVRDQFINEFPVFEDGNKRAWVKSSLETDTDVNSFRNGKLKLKCIASVYSVYHRNAELQIEEEKPRSASVMGSKDSSGKTIPLNTQGSGTPGDFVKEASKSSASSTSSRARSSLVSNFSVQFLLISIVVMIESLLSPSSSVHFLLTLNPTSPSASLSPAGRSFKVLSTRR